MSLAVVLHDYFLCIELLKSSVFEVLNTLKHYKITYTGTPYWRVALFLLKSLAFAFGCSYAPLELIRIFNFNILLGVEFMR
jgi:hypothetical protein